MKFPSIALIIIAFAWCSCTKKASVRPSAVFSATVNGVNENFTVNDSVSFMRWGPDSSLSGLYISGTNPVNNDHIIVAIASPNPTVGPNTYYTDKGAAGSMIMFRDAGISLPKDPYPGLYYTIDLTDQRVDYAGSITLTEVNDQVVKGTFSGELISVQTVVQGASLTSRSVTKGQFNINLNTLKH